jgi:hypothetical protein
MESTNQPSSEFIVSSGVLTFEEFIKLNPYPTFEEMEQLQTRRFDLDAEYGLINHDLCKTVYESLHLPNKNVYVDKWIEKVTERGGYHALYCNLETLRLFSPISKIIDQDHYKEFQEIYDNVMNLLNDKFMEKLSSKGWAF